MFLGGCDCHFLMCLHCCDWYPSFFPYLPSPIPRCQTSNAFRRRSEGDASTSTGGTCEDLGGTKHRRVSQQTYEFIWIHEPQGMVKSGAFWNCFLVRSDLWRVLARKAHRGMDREHRRGQEKLEEIIECLGWACYCIHGMIHHPLRSVVLELHFTWSCFNML